GERPPVHVLCDGSSRRRSRGRPGDHPDHFQKSLDSPHRRYRFNEELTMITAETQRRREEKKCSGDPVGAPNRAAPAPSSLCPLGAQTRSNHAMPQTVQALDTIFLFSASPRLSGE